MTTLLDRCAALIAKIGRGPEGIRIEDGCLVAVLKDDDKLCTLLATTLLLRQSHTACILQVWLEEELVFKDYDINIGYFTEVVYKGDREIIASNLCTFTALIEAAEEVLVAA